MRKISAETQYSIYKIDFDSLDNVVKIVGEKGSEDYLENATVAIINSVCSLVRKKHYSQVQRIKYQGFSGVVFKTVHEPTWKTAAEHIIMRNEIEDAETPSDFLTNTNVSYILLYTV